jgi:hypothetical protein
MKLYIKQSEIGDRFIIVNSKYEEFRDFKGGVMEITEENRENLKKTYDLDDILTMLISFNKQES